MQGVTREQVPVPSHHRAPTIISALRQYSPCWLNIDPCLKALSNGNYHRDATTLAREAFVDNCLLFPN